MRVGIQTRSNKGIFQLAINGLNVGQPEDEYYPSVSYDVRDLGAVTISTAGNYAFKFLVTARMRVVPDTHLPSITSSWFQLLDWRPSR